MLGVAVSWTGPAYSLGGLFWHKGGVSQDGGGCAQVAERTEHSWEGQKQRVIKCVKLWECRIGGQCNVRVKQESLTLKSGFVYPLSVMIA